MKYYVTVAETAKLMQVRYLLGPYDTHEEALSNIPRGKGLAKCDPRSPWYYYGTAGTEAILPTLFGR